MIYLTAGALAALIVVVVLVLRAVATFITTERAQMATERHQWAQERADLLQRIQAPAEAVMAHAIAQPLPSPQHVPIDDDDAFWEANMTKEQFAQAAFERELAEA